MYKTYKAIFFDWDGTAVMSRQAPVEETVQAMKPLLQKGIKLIIVSGTTYDKIAGGEIHKYFTKEENENLYLGLGGTGLGLSIVKHGAILHGAKVQVDSEYGKGTRMEIIFPEK